MYDKIAVLTDGGGRTAPLDQSSKILLYQEIDSKWQVMKVIDWHPTADQTIAAIRGDIKTCIDQLEDCRIIVGKKLSGVAYHFLDKMNFHIFETDHPASQSLFYSIRQAITESEDKRNFINQTPVQTPVSPNNDGIYYFNLIELQQVFPEISSKKALKAFMEKAAFYKFELICNHIPPWLESMMLLRKFRWEVERFENNSSKITVLNLEYS